MPFDLSDPGVVAGLLLAGAGIPFLIGAGNPGMVRVWTSPDAIALPIVAAHRTSWRATNVLIAIAAAVTTPGVVLLAGVIGSPAATAAAVLYAIAAIAWLIVLLERLDAVPLRAERYVAGTLTPVDEAVTAALGRWTGALFAAWSLLSGVALVVLGATALGTAIPAPAAWLSIAAGAVEVVMFLLTGDVPPFVAYLATLGFGIALLLGPR